MELPSRLRDTTLGDLLASLHRAGAHGVLELIDLQARRHAIHLRRGHIQAVECTASGVRLGDVAASTRKVARAHIERTRMLAHARGIRLGQALIAERLLTPLELDELLTEQQRLRLAMLYNLRDAELRFRVARPLPEGASEQQPLSPREAFHDRPRKRPRAFAHPTERTSVSKHPSRSTSALRALGLEEGATSEQIRAAYRRLVFELHPDRAPVQTETERAQRSKRLLEVLRAFRTLQA